MNEKTIKVLWNTSNHQERVLSGEDKALDVIQQKMKKFRKKNHARDMLNIMITVLIYAWFVSDLFNKETTWLSLLGVGLIIVSILALAYNLWKGKHHISTEKSSHKATYIDNELAYVRQQIQLMKGIFWWYFAPLFIGAECYLWGRFWPEINTTEWIFGGSSILCLCVFGIIAHILIQRMIKQQFIPLLGQLLVINR